jgi:hypothetical protein
MAMEMTPPRPSERKESRLRILIPVILGLAFATGWLVEVWRGHAPESDAAAETEP